jgi:glycogen(starch) synthase
MPSAYPPQLGGVEELTRHLALTLGRLGDRVEVWTLHPDDGAAETAAILDGLVVRRFPMPLPATRVSALWRTATVGTRTLFSLRKAVAAFRPDVLHVQCFGPNGAYATALSRLERIPLVVSLQGETMMSRSLRAALRRGLASAAAVTGCSAFTLDDAVTRFGLAPDRGEVVWNGVDLDVAAPPAGADPVRERTGSDRPYLLALGRVVENKGFDLLVQAYALSAAARTGAGPGADLVVAGSGGASETLTSLADQLGLADRVHLIGRLDRDEVAAALARALAFVMPSRLEPFGIVVLEAWRAGTAVIASSRGGAPEFVRDGEDGLLVDPFDAPALAAALDRVVTQPDVRRDLATAGRARVASFGWPEITRSYQRIYDRVGGRLTVDPSARSRAASTQREPA